jgi:hypothetical protein
MNQSTHGYDLIDESGIRYEVKARRLKPGKSLARFSAIQSIEDRHFDFLVGGLFNADFTIHQAAFVPWEVVRRKARLSKHTNAWTFTLRPDVMLEKGVRGLVL